jgi:hypothetical protein
LCDAAPAGACEEPVEDVGRVRAGEFDQADAALAERCEAAGEGPTQFATSSMAAPLSRPPAPGEREGAGEWRPANWGGSLQGQLRLRTWPRSCRAG